MTIDLKRFFSQQSKYSILNPLMLFNQTFRDNCLIQRIIFSKQGIYQLSKSGEARFQIMLKVGGQNQKSMACISDFGQNLAKVGEVDKCHVRDQFEVVLPIGLVT